MRRGPHDEDATGIPLPTGLTWRDLWEEAAAGITRRPARSALTALGTLLGVGSFVATLALTGTAAAQVGGRFDALKATEVTLRDSPPDDAVGTAFPSDTDERLEMLNGVVSGGVYWEVELGNSPVSAAAALATVDNSSDITVVAASPGLLTAARTTMLDGVTYSASASELDARIAVLGRGAARRLGIASTENDPAVYLGGIPFVVVGIVGDVQRKPDLLLSVIIPDAAAADLWGQPAVGTAAALVEVEIGAAQLVARQAPLALRPHDPDRLEAVTAPELSGLRQGVEQDFGSLFLLLAAVSLVIGALSIANTSLVSVLERTSEIGLRRALGATRKHVAAQFLTESALLGTLGGLIGATMGVVVVVTVAAMRHWTVVLEPTLVLPAPLLGTLIGLTAGAYPAFKAARLAPITALRR